MSWPNSYAVFFSFLFSFVSNCPIFLLPPSLCLLSSPVHSDRAIGDIGPFGKICVIFSFNLSVYAVGLVPLVSTCHKSDKDKLVEETPFFLLALAVCMLTLYK